MNKSTLDQTLENLRNCGEQLVRYNVPQNDEPFEDYIYPLKMAHVEVDGYSVLLQYSKADWGHHYLESLQISGVNIPFLPFHVVTKIARRALGGHHLSLIRVPTDGRVYYCWTICTDKEGRPLPFQHPGKMTKCEFEGFEFGLLSSDSVNFH